MRVTPMLIKTPHRICFDEWTGKETLRESVRHETPLGFIAAFFAALI